MSTPDSAAAFAKLVAKRARLSEVSKELRDAMANQTNVLTDHRFRELQREWEQALNEMEAATEEFSAIIKHLHEDVEKHD